MDILKDIKALAKEHEELFYNFLSEIQNKYDFYHVETLDEVNQYIYQNLCLGDPIDYINHFYLGSMLSNIKWIKSIVQRDKNDSSNAIKSNLNYLIFYLNESKKEWNNLIEKCEDAIWSLDELTTLCKEYIKE